MPTVSIYGISGQPNLHSKIPMGSPRAAHFVAHVQPMGSEVGSSPVFSVWVCRIFQKGLIVYEFFSHYNLHCHCNDMGKWAYTFDVGEIYVQKYLGIFRLPLQNSFTLLVRGMTIIVKPNVNDGS